MQNFLQGNTFSSRLPSQILGNSVVLWHEDQVFIEWQTERIRKWEHFVPFKYDYSDMTERLDWLESHQEEAKEIARRGREQISKHVRLEDMKCYGGLLLIEYQHLLK